MDQYWITVAFCLAAIAFVLWRFPEWIRAEKEDRERWEEWAKERNRAYDYRNIPARLDKWQQERSEMSLDQRWEEWASNRLK